ncbi:GNAT family N-acetyltransferase [Bacillus spongiae]|uniref:GNAT family N-acetyltransferase n=1 Tax=Bacillus spongiae TaxID=2683610 RepID=A0ABU8HC20_9BACI
MVNLIPMTNLEFEKYIETSVSDFANQSIASGNWSEGDALQKAKEKYHSLLPDGKETANQYFYTIFDTDQEVGILWFAQKTTDLGYIYDIRIDENRQGNGYGKAAMYSIERIAKEELGLKKIGLHVFGHNKVARDLYEKLGYDITNLVMEKVI